MFLCSCLLVAGAAVTPVSATTRYVSLDGLHVAPYTNWTAAATNIQAAVNTCAPGDEVVMSNGIYHVTATVRVTNNVALKSWNGRDSVLLDGSLLAATQDVVFLQFGTLDGLTISNAPRHGVKSEYGSIWNSRIVRSGQNGIDSYTTPRLVSNSTLVVTNTIIAQSQTNGISTCAVDTRILGCEISGSGAAGVSLRQNDTTGTLQVPRVSNFLIRASTVSSNAGSGIAVAFWNYDATLPDVPVRIEDCRITDNAGARGGGVSDGGGTSTDRSSGLRISGCTILRNSASLYGGGVYFQGNRAPLICNSTIEENTAYEGGGLYLESGSMNNCLVRNNTSSFRGGGVRGASVQLLNNTIIENTSADRAGGIYFTGVAGNSIIYSNRAPSSPDVSGGSFTYCNISTVTAGTGNFSALPGFAGYRNWHLVAGSPCIDAGDWSLVEGDTDLDGDPRVWSGNADIGCDEFYLPALDGPLAVTVEARANRAVVGAQTYFRCDIAGRPVSYVWRFTDGFSATNAPDLQRTFDAPGTYTAWVVATNLDGAASNSVSIEIFPGYTNYVAPAGGHVSPFTNWTTAATTLQAAVEANIPGGVVLVEDGTYDTGGFAVDGGPTNRVAVTNALTIISVHGPDYASIVGHGPCGPDAVRCAYLAADARLSGFTLMNGATLATGDADRNQSGGGVWCESNAVVENCILQDNLATAAGGGIKNGAAQDCVLRGNQAPDGGGAADAGLTQCLLVGNSAGNEGGGAYGGTVLNSLVASNQAAYGGGCARAVLDHVSVAANHALQSGGGTYGGVASNSIVYLNSAGVSWSNYFNTICRYTCTAPDPLSLGNVVADPGFAGAAAGNFRLRGDSPALDAALASGVTNDLLGVPRPLAGVPGGDPAPDMGAYEYTAVHYVAPGGAHVYPFLSWADAATDLQSALDAADPFDTVLTSNGVYATGGRASTGALTNRVTVGESISLRAVNGLFSASIEGGGPVGDAAVRGVYLGTNAVLAGFTVRHGATRAAGDADLEQSGGGIWCAPGAVVSNCMIVSNSANALGGGVRGGLLFNSFLTGNSAAQGGGLARGAVEFCTLTENTAADGGGAYESTGRCSIIYFNSATGSGPNVQGGTWDTCCTTPDPGGSGNFTNDPALLAPGDYQLATGSPCIDAVPLAAPFPGNDLDSVARPLDGDNSGTPQADIGAFEFIHATADTDGDGLSDHDEIGAYGTDPIHADPDGDGQSDREELIAGMDPYDPASFFAILDATNGTSGGVFTWPGRDHRLYTVYAADNLAAGMTNRPDYTDQPGTDGLMAFTNSSPGAATMFGVGVRLAP